MGGQVNHGPHSIILEVDLPNALLLPSLLEVCHHFAACKVTIAHLQNLKDQVVTTV